MLKLLMILMLSSLVLLGADESETLDDKVIAFVQKSVIANENYTFDKVSILEKKDVPELKPWKAYVVRVDVTLLKPESKKISMNDIVFTDGVVLSRDLLDLKSAQSLKTTLFISH
ncbi:hypothetical protein [Sulfurospirillum barnesii]|uniref:Uncharacterized protein n=1 Tax=Sulfurospirillum barnesii (strain ATCC 700032 / DSM 10660 / SES-3) TaxID=760154 RepID=I3XXJ9_SULBS|nr:hypothetical protein [Sulfurospirillum barnesii]AFL68673.1 hypothetical protein Sulba_1384 [Sulfurospirillum barnesii SES-3]